MTPKIDPQTALDKTAAESIKASGYQQGSLFTPNGVIKIPFLFDAEKEILIIITQSCSVVSQNFSRDPLVEAIVATQITKEDPITRTGKNQRKLHIKVPEGLLEYSILELDLNRRFFFNRELLQDISPIGSIEKEETKKIASWIARSYTRIALPDDLVNYMQLDLLKTIKNASSRKTLRYAYRLNFHSLERYSKWL